MRRRGGTGSFEGGTRGRLIGKGNQTSLNTRRKRYRFSLHRRGGKGKRGIINRREI